MADFETWKGLLCFCGAQAKLASLNCTEFTGRDNAPEKEGFFQEQLDRAVLGDEQSLLTGVTSGS